MTDIELEAEQGAREIIARYPQLTYQDAAYQSLQRARDGHWADASAWARVVLHFVERTESAAALKGHSAHVVIMAGRKA